MSVFVIPRHKRFAVRHRVQLRNGRGKALAALLIEITLQGCRVSAADHEQLAIDSPVTIEIDGFGDIDGRVFSASDKILGIRFILRRFENIARFTAYQRHKELCLRNAPGDALGGFHE